MELWSGRQDEGQCWCFWWKGENIELSPIKLTVGRDFHPVRGLSQS